jgi:putative ABC transport system permease protein
VFASIRMLAARIAGLFAGHRQDQDFDDELSSHLEMLTDENIRHGMAPAEAQRAARVRLGGFTQLKETNRNLRGLPMIETFFQDIRYALRILRKNPGFTVLAILTLALGIGANTAVFSVASAFLRKPVSFPELNRLVMVLELAPQQTVGWSQVSPATYLDWKKQSHSFEELAAWQYLGWNLTGNGDPEKLNGARVSSNFFQTLGILPIMGRSFRPDEDQPGRGQVAIISYNLWKRRFASDPDIIGKTVDLDHQACDVVGVMGSEFNFPLAVDIWRPLALSPEEQTLRSRHDTMPIGRLKPGVSAHEAWAEITTIEGRLQKEFPQTETSWSIKTLPIGVFVSGEITDQYCKLLIGAVLFVLLIACANVANLLFARAASRQKEIALRRALGATQLRIVRQLLTESLVLAFAGAGLGLLLGQWGIGLIRYHMPPEVELYLPMWKHVRLEPDVFWYTAALALFAGLISGLAPAFRTSRTDFHQELKEGGRGNTGSPARQRLRSTLVIVEIALSLILLMGAGLTTKGVRALLVVNQNLDPEQILTMHLSLPESKYKTPQQKAAFVSDSLARFAALPGVTHAAVATNIPFGIYETNGTVSIQGQPTQAGQFRQANIESVNASYFRVMNIPLHQGRLLEETDGPDQPLAAVISQSFAQRYFHGEDPIGKFLKRGAENSTAPWIRVVGVAGDIRYNFLGAKEAPPIYLPYQQAPEGFCFMAVRTEGDPSTFIARVRGQIASIDPDQPVSRIMTLQKVISNGLIGFSYVAAMLDVLGIMAVVFAAVGVYGVMAYSVTERTHEIGVRMALGAPQRAVLRLILSHGLNITTVGLVLGLPAAWILARFMAGIFFGVSATDLTTFGGTTFLMCLITLLACYIPARRAMRVDPIIALRCE